MSHALLILLFSLAYAAAQTELKNQVLRVSINNTDMTWSALWPQADVALRGVSFAIEVDGKTLKPQSPSTAVERTLTETIVRQSWTNGVGVTRWLRIPSGTNSGLTLSTRIVNRTGHDVSLGTQHLIDLYGPWHVGASNQNPASVYIVGASELQCLPADTASERTYHSSGVLALANKSSSSAFVVGFLTAAQARPDLDAIFRLNQGGARLLAHQPFLGRKLAAGETLDLDSVYLAAHSDPYAALEQYGDAAAAAASQPVRTRPTALWCSWYAHRMALSEDLVLSNAAVPPNISNRSGSKSCSWITAGNAATSPAIGSPTSASPTACAGWPMS
jgi:hypothetical protein